MRWLIKKCAGRVRSFLVAPTLEALGQAKSPGPDAAAQLQLRLAYRRLVEEGRPLPAVADVGFQAYSQTDEDGILWFLFSVLGTTNKLCAGSAPATASSATPPT